MFTTSLNKLRLKSNREKTIGLYFHFTRQSAKIKLDVNIGDQKLKYENYQKSE